MRAGTVRSVTVYVHSTARESVLHPVSERRAVGTSEYRQASSRRTTGTHLNRIAAVGKKNRIRIAFVCLAFFFSNGAREAVRRLE